MFGVVLMNLSDLVVALQGIEMPIIGALSPELALFVLSVAFFGFSTAVCAMAVKASSGAREAREDARIMMRTVQDYAVEMRTLTARAEQADYAARGHQETQSAEEGLSDRINGVRVGARADTAEATLSVEDAPVEQGNSVSDNEAAFDDGADSGDDATARLADATRAATEPRSLLSGMLRRR